jgi:hypothetical protein
MTMKILTLISIWYVFYFLLSFIGKIGKLTIPYAKIGEFDILGNQLWTFLPSFLFLVWNYIVK